jgi:YD repeat-containing protein
VTACTGDALAKVTTYTYDVGGRLTSITDPLGTVTTIVYDYDNDQRA